MPDAKRCITDQPRTEHLFMILRAFILVAGLIGVSNIARANPTDASPIPDRVRFNRDIRPILSEYCFTCHGFDPKTRKADLRLDIKSVLSQKLDNGLPVVAGKPADSLVYQRVVTDDVDDIMP